MKSKLSLIQLCNVVSTQKEMNIQRSSNTTRMGCGTCDHNPSDSYGHFSGL
jgi:hypothetical protein